MEGGRRLGVKQYIWCCILAGCAHCVRQECVSIVCNRAGRQETGAEAAHKGQEERGKRWHWTGES